jgi:hypothetical protein
MDTGLRAVSLLRDAVRPAVVATDPLYADNMEAFCAAYGNNRYAPDLSERALESASEQRSSP